MSPDEAKVVLLPLWSMAGGRNPDPGMIHTYAQAIADYPALIAKRGIERACHGQDFLPPAWSVSAGCESVLDEFAQSVYEASVAALTWRRGESQRFRQLPPQRRSRRLGRKWRRHWGIDLQDASDAAKKFKRDGRYRHFARLLPEWSQYETEPGVDELERLALEVVETGRLRLKA